LKKAGTIGVQTIPCNRIRSLDHNLQIVIFVHSVEKPFLWSQSRILPLINRDSKLNVFCHATECLLSICSTSYLVNLIKVSSPVGSRWSGVKAWSIFWLIWTVLRSKVVRPILHDSKSDPSNNSPFQESRSGRMGVKTFRSRSPGWTGASHHSLFAVCFPPDRRLDRFVEVRAASAYAPHRSFKRRKKIIDQWIGSWSNFVPSWKDGYRFLKGR
jgi:hypothetical protein